MKITKEDKKIMEKLEKGAIEENKNLANFKIILMVVVVALNLYFLNYIAKIEQSCECSNSWKRDYIKGFLIISTLYKVIDFSIVNLSILSFPILIAAIFNIYVIFTYIRELKHTNCNCSVDKARNVMEILNYLRIGIIFVSLLVILYLFIRIHTY